MTLWGHLSWYLKDQPKIRPYLHPEEFVGNWDGRLDMFRQYTSHKSKIGEMRCWRTQLVLTTISRAPITARPIWDYIRFIHPGRCFSAAAVNQEPVQSPLLTVTAFFLFFRSHFLILSFSSFHSPPPPSIDRLCPWVDVPLSRSAPILAAVSIAALCAAPCLWPVSDQGTLFTTHYGSLIVVP